MPHQGHHHCHQHHLGNINRSENLSESDRDYDDQDDEVDWNNFPKTDRPISDRVEDFSKYIWVRQKHCKEEDGARCPSENVND